MASIDFAKIVQESLEVYGDSSSQETSSSPLDFTQLDESLFKLFDEGKYRDYRDARKRFTPTGKNVVKNAPTYATKTQSPQSGRDVAGSSNLNPNLMASQQKKASEKKGFSKGEKVGTAAGHKSGLKKGGAIGGAAGAAGGAAAAGGIGAYLVNKARKHAASAEEARKLAQSKLAQMTQSDTSKSGFKGAVKELGRATKEKIADNPKAAAAIGATGGLLGAGLAARKYLKRKKAA